MEVFEIKKRRVERQSSTASSRSNGGSKVGYIMAMAGIILVTSAILVVLHFTRGYSTLYEEITTININKADKLQRRKCDEPFCNTRDCVSMASTILETMNLKADPCTNFYDYACGGYSRAKAIPYATDFYSPVKEAQLELLVDIRKVMDDAPLETESPIMLKMRKLYNSCMNTGVRDETENISLSFWFVDNDLVPEDYALGNNMDFEQPLQWTKLVSKLEEYQIHTLFKPHFVEKEHAAPERMEVDCLVPYLSPEAYANTTDDELAFQFMIYKEAIDAALELLHMDRSSRKEFRDDILKFETDIAKVALNVELPAYPYMSEENKQQLKEIWRSVVGEAVQDMEVISTCNYDLPSILTILNQTPKKTVVKYVFWRMLMQLMQYMGTEFRNLHIHYMTKLPGFDYAYESNWKQCAEVIRSELGLVATKILLDHGNLKTATVEAVNENFLEIKRDIALLFSTVEGVDPIISKMFLDKIKHMKLTTGYSELLNEEGIMDSIYGNMEMENNYFLNIINMKRFKTRKHLTRLWYGNNEDPMSEIDLDANPLGTKSGYNYISNTVHVDLGLLWPPLFIHSENIPNYLKYGFSSFLAREMSRAFDATGCFYEAEGRRFEKILWPTSMERRYDNFVACIGHQTERLLNGINPEINSTEGLNNIISDLGSFIIPYEGLKTHLRGHLAEKPLPGIPLTKKQTFYVQTAQMLCELRSKRASGHEAKFLLPPKLRVNGAISNMEDFGDVFNCPPESSMVVENKCSIFH